MSQYSAVYYPHTTLRTPELLKTALLLWDHVDCIVPVPGFPLTQGLAGQTAEAADIILRPRHPTAAEKKRVHEAVIAAFAHGVPGWVATALQDEYHHHGHARHDEHDYLIYPQKFMHETWEELSRARVARWLPHHADYGVPPALGLTLMASLADACAGAEQHRVTDRVAAYSALTGMATLSLGGELLSNATPSEVTVDIERLVTASTYVLGASSISLKRLIELRQREARESSHDLRRLRHKYLDAVKSHVLALGTAKTVNDAKELARQFRDTMESDLADLKRELKMARNDVLLSTPMWILLLAAAGVVASPAGAAAFAPAIKSIGVGALLNTGKKFKRARAKAFKEHAMSWLHLAGGKQGRPLF